MASDLAAAKPFSAGVVEIDTEALADGRLDADAVPLPGLADPEVTFDTTASDVPGIDAVQATLTAVDDAGRTRTATDTVWVDEVDGETVVSEVGVQDLRLQRLELLDLPAAEAQERREQVLGGGAAGTPTVATTAACAGVCVSGTIRWTDALGGIHPVDRAPVEIRDEDGDDDEVVTTVTTDAEGHYEAVVDADDGDGTGRDLYLRVRADGPGFTFDQHLDGPVSTDVPAGSEVSLDLTANAVDDNNTAFAVRAALVLAGDHVAELNGGPIQPYSVLFPGPSSSYFFGQIRLVRLDRFDGDVAVHELGHHLAARFELDDSPGGPHRLSENLASTRGKSAGIRLAWGEGLATYLGVSALAEEAASAGIPTLGDARYQDGEDAAIDVSLEARATWGEDNERTVSNALWDLYDGVDDGRDRIHLGAGEVWNRLIAGRPTTLSDAYTRLSRNRRVGMVNCVFTDMNVAPRLDRPARVGAGRPTFGWRRGNGADHRNDAFSVRLHDRNGRLLHATPFRRGQNRTISRPVWRSIRARSGGVVRVAVVARQTVLPATGPYRSCGRAYPL